MCLVLPQVILFLYTVGGTMEITADQEEQEDRRILLMQPVRHTTLAIRKAASLRVRMSKVRMHNCNPAIRSYVTR